MNTVHVEHREHISSYLADKIKADAICIYGSYSLGAWDPYRSDVDVIAICSGDNIRCHERTYVCGVEINIVYISLDTLQADAQKQEYGYLYISKFINPHSFIKDTIGCKKLVWRLVTEYLETYAFPDIFVGGEKLTVEAFIARLYLLHMNNFPHYIVKLFHTFPSLSFIHVREQFECMLNLSGLLKKEAEMYSLLDVITSSYRPYFHERVRLRWWQTFQDYRVREKFLSTQIEKSRAEITQNPHQIKTLITFLNVTAGIVKGTYPYGTA